MIAKARERLGEGTAYVVSDLSELTLPQPVDLVFSTATFHWIVDHDRLFARLRQNLVPGGRLVAQCGGDGNVAEHARAIAAVASRPEYAPHFEGMGAMWNFAAAGTDRGEAAGGRLRRGALLAGAEALHAGRPAAVHDDRHPRTAPGAVCRSRRGSHSPKPCSSSADSR